MDYNFKSYTNSQFYHFEDLIILFNFIHIYFLKSKITRKFVHNLPRLYKHEQNAKMVGMSIKSTMLLELYYFSIKSLNLFVEKVIFKKLLFKFYFKLIYFNKSNGDVKQILSWPMVALP